MKLKILLLICIAVALLIYMWEILLTDKVSAWGYYTICGLMAGIIANSVYVTWHILKGAKRKYIYVIVIAVVTIIKIINYIR